MSYPANTPSRSPSSYRQAKEVADDSSLQVTPILVVFPHEQPDIMEERQPIPYVSLTNSSFIESQVLYNGYSFMPLSLGCFILQQ